MTAKHKADVQRHLNPRFFDNRAIPLQNTLRCIAWMNAMVDNALWQKEADDTGHGIKSSHTNTSMRRKQIRFDSTTYNRYTRNQIPSVQSMRGQGLLGAVVVIRDAALFGFLQIKALKTCGGPQNARKRAMVRQQLLLGNNSFDKRGKQP